MPNKGYVMLDTNDQFVGNSTPYGEMYIFNNSVATVINTVNKPHLVLNFAEGELNKWTFNAGTSGSITHTINNGSGTLRIYTADDHNLTDGDIISVVGLASGTPNAISNIVVVSGTVMDCTKIPYFGSGETGNWYKGSSLRAGSGAAGVYCANLAIPSITSGGDNKKYGWKLYQNTTALNNIATSKVIVVGTDGETVDATGYVTISENDFITLAVTGMTDTTNLTHVNANVNLHKL